MTKKEIYFQELPKFRSSGDAIQSAMDIYAKQEVVDFVNWADKNNWLLRSYKKSYRWLNFGVPVKTQVQLTTAQLYDEYKSTQS